MHHPTDRIAHTTAFVTPVVEHWLEQETAQWVHPMKDRSDDPSHHERKLLPRSYISLQKLSKPAVSESNDTNEGRKYLFSLRIQHILFTVILVKCYLHNVVDNGRQYCFKLKKLSSNNPNAFITYNSIQNNQIMSSSILLNSIIKRAVNSSSLASLLICPAERRFRKWRQNECT